METRIETYKKNHKTKQFIMILWLLGGSCIWSQLTFADGQWIVDQKGCKVWNPNPAPNESITWSGACPSGYANGYGILQWYESGRAGDRYEGLYLKGKRSGKGLQVWANGNRYEGDWLENQATGKGVWLSKNGDRYEGDWVKGKRTGYGIFTGKKGNRFEGQIVNDVFDGQCNVNADELNFNGICKNNLPYNGTAMYKGESVVVVNGERRKDPSSSATSTSSMGASFLTGLLKTAVGVAVARQTGNNALGAQVALASTPEEINSLTNQVALEARQHSEAEIRKKQEIRDQQARQLQEQQAAMQRAQQQANYGSMGNSSNRSYGAISSGSVSSNNYGNSSTTISNGQNNSSSSSNNQPKTERINVPSQTGCVSFAWDKQDGNTQWFKFRNDCAYPINVYWRTTAKGGYAAELRSGQSQSGWLLRDRDKIENYKACGLKNGKYDINYDRATNQCWSYADFR